MTDQYVTGFMMLKNGQLRDKDFLIAHSERSLLIGYDLIPLRGLDQTKKVLAEKGLAPSMVNVEVCDEADRTCYAATFNGMLHLEMLEYTVCNANPQCVFHTTASFFGHGRYLQIDEQATVKRYYYFPKEDGRRRSTYAKLTAQVNAIFEKYGISVVPIRIFPVGC